MKNNHFCIINTAPWLKWLNHFLWEKNKDYACDKKNYIPYYKQNISPKTFEFDYHILTLAKILEIFWKHKLKNKYYNYLDVVIKDDLLVLINSCI